MSRKLEMKGKKFGRLTVISDFKSDKGNFKCNCICECGKKSHRY